MPSRSPFSSPSRKRQRLSSPTYDNQLEDLSQYDLDAFDQLDRHFFQMTQQRPQEDGQENEQSDGLSQSSDVFPGRNTVEDPFQSEDIGPDIPASPPKSHSTQTGVNDAESLPRLSLAPASRLIDSTDAPVVRGAATMFQSAANLLANNKGVARVPSSPSPPPEDKDYSSWFGPPEDESIPVSFTSAKSLATGASASFAPASLTLGSATSASTSGFSSASSLSGFSSAAGLPGSGFMKASSKGILAPSAAALAKAAQKIKSWQDEEEDELESASSLDKLAANGIIDEEPRLSPLTEKNITNPEPAPRSTPETPTPALAHPGFSRATLATVTQAIITPRNLLKSKNKPFKPPSLMPGAATQSSQFNSPVSSFKSPLNSQRPPKFSSTLAGSSSFVPPPMVTPRKDGTRGIEKPFVTPIRPSLGATPRSMGTPRRFVTPFKPGIGPKPVLPGTPVAPSSQTPLSIQSPIKPGVRYPPSATPDASMKRADRPQVFNLKKPPGRKTLASSGLYPNSYNQDEYEAMSIPIQELNRISPTTAMYYYFKIPSASSSSSSSAKPLLFNAEAALHELKSKECTLATKPWVENHWSLILWKLAGMVIIDPESEGYPHTRRWCREEVVRQLLYRYERELNRGSRPPLRKIAAQDAPPSVPMVLCVSNIFWSGGGMTEDGYPIDSIPELEVTDGWYRLRAQVDEPLARAIRRRKIKVGSKVSIANVKLLSEKKEPAEILEAYDTNKLLLFGNSSQLAPWHAKLGWCARPSVTTLHALSPDGGIVTLVDVTVVKAYPLAFIEFVEDENGNKTREGPRNEADEHEADERWKRRREREESKLRDEFEKRWSRLDQYAERLEHQAGSTFRPSHGDSPPDHIDSLWDQIESAEPAEANPILARLSASDAGWLSRLIREEMQKESERSIDNIASELKTICPPREVRDFRVVVVEDSVTHRRPKIRSAQLTVWDAKSLVLTEGVTGGSFEPGQRFLVTNLMPSQQNSWMHRTAPESTIYLTTRRDSRWIRTR